MANKNYSELLKSPLWQKKRLEILNRDNFTCQVCGDTETMLSIHHKKYTAKNIWEEPIENLSTVCKHCHFIVHQDDNIFDKNKQRFFNGSVKAYKQQTYLFEGCKLYDVIINEGIYLSVLKLTEDDDGIAITKVGNIFDYTFDLLRKVLKEV